MWERIAKYVHPVYRYKLPIEYRNLPYTPLPVVTKAKQLIPVEIHSISALPITHNTFGSGTVGYDIETTTHNYFCNGILVHNSSLTAYKTEMVKPTFTNKVRQFFRLQPKVDVHFGVCSRNLELKRPSNDGKQSDFWDAVKKYEIEQGLPTGYAVQGELISPRIQGNHEKVNEVMFYIFDVYDINKQCYLLPKERKEFVLTYLPIALHVPVVNECVAIFEECSLEQLLSRVEGESINKGTISEGRVYKSNKYNHVHFKAISNKYLLKKHD
jgi:hypothetical protein